MCQPATNPLSLGQRSAKAGIKAYSLNCNCLCKNEWKGLLTGLKLSPGFLEPSQPTALSPQIIDIKMLGKKLQ